jgi:hypothetical protein
MIRAAEGGPQWDENLVSAMNRDTSPTS